MHMWLQIILIGNGMEEQVDSNDTTWKSYSDVYYPDYTCKSLGGGLREVSAVDYV
jgi:hypothetical protein